MAKELTRTGVVGLELTREEVIDLFYNVKDVMEKAQCREVNCDVIDALHDISVKLADVQNDITNILESD